MWNKSDFLKTSEPPYSRGVVARGKAREVKETVVQPVSKPSDNTVKEALLRAVLAEIAMPDLPGNFDNMPFKDAKKLAALRAIETYLSSQLVQVRKEINKLTQESVAENEVKDERVDGLKGSGGA